MGGCFGHLKRNRVSPDPSFNGEEAADDINARLSRATPFQASSSQEKLDMIKDLTPDQAPVLARGGLSFDVGYRPATPGVRAPSRLVSNDNKSQTDKVLYSCEEKEVMAGLLREDILAERRHKASRDVKLENAARRRAAMRADDNVDRKRENKDENE